MLARWVFTVRVVGSCLACAECSQQHHTHVAKACHLNVNETVKEGVDGEQGSGENEGGEMDKTDGRRSERMRGRWRRDWMNIVRGRIGEREIRVEYLSVFSNTVRYSRI